MICCSDCNHVLIMFYRDIDDLAIKDKLKLKIKDRLYEYKPGKAAELGYGNP